MRIHWRALLCVPVACLVALIASHGTLRTADAHGTIDQFLTGDPGCLPSVLRASAPQSGSLRQEFVPNAAVGTGLQHIALCLTMSSTSNLLVTVRSGTAASPGPVIGTAGANGVLGGSRWAEFEFPLLVPITGGATYVIEVSGFPAFSWRGTCGVVLMPSCPTTDPDLYPAGVPNAPAPIGDLAFRTYSSFDQDADGIGDTIDNCPSDSNTGQENHDGNFIDLTPPKAQDDLTWINSDPMGDACEDDDDNDGLLDSTETSLPAPACPAASAATDPTLGDSDGDRIFDGPECALGTDPMNPASSPSPSACGTTADPDGDRLTNRVEVCNYNSNPNSANTDGDACNDGKEVASLNIDTTVNSIDQALLAGEYGAAPPHLLNMDMNRDGQINSIDQAIQATQFGSC